MGAKYKAYEKQFSSLQRQIDALGEAHEDLLNEASVIESQMEEKIESIKEDEKELRALTRSHEALTKQIKASDDKLTQLVKQLEALERKAPAENE